MDLGTALSVAQTLFSALQCKELNEMCSFLGYKKQLDDLQGTVATVKAVLRDIETKQELSHQAELWVEELKDAVYDADDLLDKFITKVQQKQLIKGSKVSKEVRLFFSRYNPLGVAYNMSKGVQKIQSKLDAIAKNHTMYGFSVDSQTIRRRREESCSYVYEANIVGREDDVDEIIGHLFNESKQEVSFLTVVGIGGLGKTALAQLVYNDKRVESAYPLRLWTCISDHDQDPLDVEQILRKILSSATGQNHDGSHMDSLQKQLREKLTSNKYLLVLDDVWTESHSQWLKLEEFFLLDGYKGSQILVTTRSHETARIIGDGTTHELQGLSIEDSWCLFKKIAFKADHSDPHGDLVEIGQKIVEGCAGVPLAIRVAGGLLYGQCKSKWLSFQQIGLFDVREIQKDIMPILKLSYHQLESPLKSCFTYCALFPKDFVIRKELIISLWMAQGYIVPLDDDQRMDDGKRVMEDAAEEYFSILLSRCFFQDIKHNDFGEIISFKIHDLMHDVAQKVARKEIYVTNDGIDNLDKKVRHLGHIAREKESINDTFTNSHIRSYLTFFTKSDCFKLCHSSLEALLANWTCLRALDLSNSKLESLPESIGDMVHLRHLDLSSNDKLEVLPNSITKLYNLQTLKLQDCSSLKVLPKDLMKLVNLRILDIGGCRTLTNMPQGISKLTNLHMLSMFVVNATNLSQKQWLHQLGELRNLSNSLKGELKIEVTLCENDRGVKEDGRGVGAYLRSKGHLRDITITIHSKGNEEEALKLMEEMQPHPNVKGFTLCESILKGLFWAAGKNLVTNLPNLIRLVLLECDVEYLTCLGHLPHLKYLGLVHLRNLKYIYEYSALAASGEPISSMSDGLSSIKLFPSLIWLMLFDLPKLKEWRNSGGDNDQLHIHTSSNNNMELISLPQLETLRIGYCPNMSSSLLCPSVQMLYLEKFNKRLQISTTRKYVSGDKIEDVCGRSFNTSTTTSLSSSSSSDVHKLRDVKIDNVSWLNSFAMEDFPFLFCLSINDDKEIESLGEARNVFCGSLRELIIENCPKLQNVFSGGLEELTALECLRIARCPMLILLWERESGDGIDMSRLSLCHSLRCLLLHHLPQMTDLPNWIQFLAALRELVIDDCKGLKSLPDWMSKLTSLQKFELTNCSVVLKERCQRSTGEDWPHIQHIPSIKFER